jgi:type II secretory pathway pseudopilin PulG
VGKSRNRQDETQRAVYSENPSMNPAPFRPLRLRNTIALATFMATTFLVAVPSRAQIPNRPSAKKPAQAAPQTTPQNPATPQTPPHPTASGPQAPAHAAAASPDAELSTELKKYPGLLEEFGRLLDKLRQDVPSPAPRSESHLLPLLPESTVVYGAASNYGDTVSHSLAVLRQELQDSPVLKSWWTTGAFATSAPKFESALEKISQLYEYLGNETVLSVASSKETLTSLQTQKSSVFITPKDPGILLVAEVRKPGLDAFLRRWLAESTDAKSKPGVRIFNPEELATAKDAHASDQQLMVLVRPDYVAAAFDLPTLRSFNDRVKNLHTSSVFATSAFGQRVSSGYSGGLTILAAADLQTLIQKIPFPTKDNQQTFERSGFADLSYASLRRGSVDGQESTDGQLSFSAPRHGAAAWLASPGPLGSLDFVSPKANYAMALRLTSFSQILDDVQAIAGPANANSFAAIGGGEKALNLSLKKDLLDLLGEDLTLEMDHTIPPPAAWKVIVRVKDAEHFQKTLNTLLTVGHMAAQPAENSGVKYNTIHIPGQNPMDIAYAFEDNYLVVASNADGLLEALQLHGSPDSLAKSAKYLASLPKGGSPNTSAVLYQNAGNFTALETVSPQFAIFLKQHVGETSPSVVRVYAEPTVIRETSANSGMDATSLLMIAAVAIPNLLRSGMAANEASAIGSLRSINTAQITYVATYDQRGYAPSLAALGPNPNPPLKESPEHGGLLNENLAGADCTGSAWCEKSGYRFQVASVCKLDKCTEYVSFAAPANENTGTRTFCSTSDGVIRYKIGTTVKVAPSATECRVWPALK